MAKVKRETTATDFVRCAGCEEADGVEPVYHYRAACKEVKGNGGGLAGLPFGPKPQADGLYCPRGHRIEEEKA